MTTAWADERLYYPLHTLPYQPASTLPGGRSGPQFATKGQRAARLAARPVAAGVGFRALVADCFYGPSQSPQFIADLETADIPYVVALKPNLPIRVDTGGTATPAQAAAAVGFPGRPRPGRWPRIRAYLTPLHDLQRLARAGALSLLTTQTTALVANLNQGNGIRLYLPP